MAFRDERWSTNRGRAYWLWIENGEHPGSFTAEWFIEFFDAPLEPERNFRVFVPSDATEDYRGFCQRRSNFDPFSPVEF